MLRVRLVSAIILIPVVAFFVYRGGFLFALGMAIVAALALNEFFRMLSHQGDRPLWLLGGGATALLILNGLGLGETLDQAAIMLLVFGGLLWELGAAQKGNAMRGWALTIAGVLYIGWPLGLAVALRELDQGLFWIIVAALGVWSCDTGAYFGGRFLGGKLSGNRRFSARWSPNKTWEGFFTGTLLCLVVTAILSVWLLELALWQGVLFGLFLGPSAVYGDLTESMVKRRVGVKDSGALIPGHGGMLDRIDSILFGAVAAYFFARWVVY
ncbi:MAG: phosphatidate cytidylyltransferase [Chloroflexota bacterium]|nr:phosphatidate cytidylyltransferase [Chloroflexota bacterium]